MSKTITELLDEMNNLPTEEDRDIYFHKNILPVIRENIHKLEEEQCGFTEKRWNN